MKEEIRPLISVVMSIYEEPEEWISLAIDSVLAQTYSNFEFIIINDCPTRKENIVLLSNYQLIDKRIVIFNNPDNKGLTKSLNQACSLAKGSYIARMDADDICMPSRFEEQLDYLKNNSNCGVCGCAVLEIGEEGEEILKKHSYGARETLYDFPFMLFPFFFHSTVMIRKSVLNQLPYIYDEHYLFSQDFDLWRRLYKVTDFYNLKNILLKYRVSSKQISFQKKQEQQKYAIEIRDKFVNSFQLDRKVDMREFSTADIPLMKILFKKIGMNNNGYAFSLFLTYRLIKKKKITAISYLLIHDVDTFSFKEIISIFTHILSLKR